MTVFDYLFTTGGIGPTHDDITAESVAEAIGRKLIQHPEVVVCSKNILSIMALNSMKRG